MPRNQPKLKKYSISMIFRKGSSYALCGHVTSASNEENALKNAIAANANLISEGYRLTSKVVLQIHDSLFSVPPNESDRP